MVLGAILAGGQSRRFGSDKALAMLDGRPLIAHAIAALAAECSSVVVCGRDWPGHTTLPDRPGPGLGPLAGLCAALHHARMTGHGAVLTSACDLPHLPLGLLQRLSPGPAIAAGQPTLGLWPASLADALEAHLLSGIRSLFSWVEACGVRSVDCGPLPNINTPEDLAKLC